MACSLELNFEAYEGEKLQPRKTTSKRELNKRH